MLRNFGLWLADLQAPGHTEVNDPLSFGADSGFSAMRSIGDGPTIKFKHDVLAHAMNLGNATLLEDQRHFRRRRLQRLFLATDPDGFDHVSSDTPGKTAGNRFYIGQFGHG